MQIAENVLVKLPSSMLLPEIRHTQQIKETRIAGVIDSNDDEAPHNFNDDEYNKMMNRNVENATVAEEDMV